MALTPSFVLLEPAPDLQCLPEMPPLVRREKMKTRSNTEADTAYEWIWEPYPRQIEIRVCEEKRADGLVRVHEVGKSIA